MRLAAVSVDLDEIGSYHAIHGLEAPSSRDAAHLVYDVALDRLRAWASAVRIPLTLFAVGADLAHAPSAAGLRATAAEGHEIGNHSQDHLYDLTRRPRAEIVAQVEEGARSIARATGVSPTGFRAPGYTITDEVFDVLAELGVAYDSSVFPCPAYWGAKTAAIGLIRARGRTSRSVVDDPRVLLAPTSPYRAGAPYWRRGTGMLELPIQVTRTARLPFIGTTITLAGPTRASWLARMCVGAPLVNLELHGIDVLDVDDGLEALRPHQPDVRVRRARKLDALSAVHRALAKAGYAFVTLSEAADAFRARTS